MSSIRSILEDYAYKAINEFDDNHEITISTDRALKEIEELIDVVKPEDNCMDCNGVSEYQSNLKSLLK